MPDWLIQIGGTVASIGALYGAIRADLQHAMKSSEAAHKRLDDHIGDHLRGVLGRPG